MTAAAIQVVTHFKSFLYSLEIINTPVGRHFEEAQDWGSPILRAAFEYLQY